MSRWCSVVGNSQLETRENDFFFLKGGRKTRGSGGARGRSSDRSSMGVTCLKGVVNTAAASSKLFALCGMLTIDLDGAVCGRSVLKRSANEGADGGSAGIDGIGSDSGIP